MPRVTVADWLEAVESKHGPMPAELRHLCHVLARTLDGDRGAYRGSRDIADRMGVHRSTVSRYIGTLAACGWLELEERRTQFARKGYRYFAALPLALLSAPIGTGIGASESANSGNGARTPTRIGAAQADIGARGGEIGAPGRARLLLTLAEKSAAAPLPADAGSAAPESERDRKLRADVRRYRDLGYSNQRIVELIREWYRPPATADEIEAIR